MALLLLLVLQDLRVGDAVRALDSDDPEARSKAVRTLIELEADDAVRELAKSPDGEKRLRAGEVIAAVALFRKAPGLRQLWKDDPARVSPPLIAKLAAAPRDTWPEILGTAVGPITLTAKARDALAADILSDANAAGTFLQKLGSVLADALYDRLADAAPPPVATWWFCLALLRTDLER